MSQDAASKVSSSPIEDNGRMRESSSTSPSSDSGIKSRLPSQEYIDALIAEQERLRQLHGNLFPLISSHMESEISRMRVELASQLASSPAAQLEMRNFKPRFEFIDELPAEMLGQIAAKLSSKDFNCLSRCNKTMRRKIELYRKKIPMAIDIKANESGTVMFGTRLYFDKVLRVRYSTAELCDKNVSRLYTDEEQGEEIAGHYYRNRELAYHNNKAITMLDYGVNQGLVKNLRYLHSQKNVYFESIILEDVANEHLEQLSKFLEDNQLCVPQVTMAVVEMPEQLPAFISACGPTRFYLLESGPWSSTHERLLDMDKIQKLDEFEMIVDTDGGQGFILSDQVFLKLKVASLNLRDICVTTAALRQFLLDWSREERAIQSLKVQVGVDPVSSQEWRDVLVGLNRRLVDVVEKADEPEKTFSATLRRRSDGVEVTMKWKERKVHIEG